MTTAAPTPADLGTLGRPSPFGRATPSVARVARSQIELIVNRLSTRDWQILETVNLLRVVTGQQLQRLFFASLPSRRSQTASRTRVLRRLVGWRLLVPLERRIGGSGRGSSAMAFALDSVGQRLIARQQLAAAQPMRVRRPGTPTDRTLGHTLAVTEVYVGLVELSRSQGFTVADYQAEPACWWSNGLKSFLKPDAYLRLELGEVVDHWWVEVDRATESLPTVRRKLEAYLDFVRRGQLGPGGVVPRVLVSTITEPRRQAVDELVGRLPPPARELFVVVHSDQAVRQLCHILRG